MVCSNLMRSALSIAPGRLKAARLRPTRTRIEIGSVMPIFCRSSTPPSPTPEMSQLFSCLSAHFGSFLWYSPMTLLKKGLNFVKSVTAAAAGSAAPLGLRTMAGGQKAWMWRRGDGGVSGRQFECPVLTCRRHGVATHARVGVVDARLDALVERVTVLALQTLVVGLVEMLGAEVAGLTLPDLVHLRHKRQGGCP